MNEEGFVVSADFGGTTYKTFGNFPSPAADGRRPELAPLPAGTQDSVPVWSKAALVSSADPSRLLPVSLHQGMSRSVAVKKKGVVKKGWAVTYTHAKLIIDLASHGLPPGALPFLRQQSGLQKGQLALGARGCLLKSAVEKHHLFKGFFPVTEPRVRKKSLQGCHPIMVAHNFNRCAIAQISMFAASHLFITPTCSYWYNEGECVPYMLGKQRLVSATVDGKVTWTFKNFQAEHVHINIGEDIAGRLSNMPYAKRTTAAVGDFAAILIDYGVAVEIARRMEISVEVAWDVMQSEMLADVAAGTAGTRASWAREWAVLVLNRIDVALWIDHSTRRGNEWVIVSYIMLYRKWQWAANNAAVQVQVEKELQRQPQLLRLGMAGHGAQEVFDVVAPVGRDLRALNGQVLQFGAGSGTLRLRSLKADIADQLPFLGATGGAYGDAPTYVKTSSLHDVGAVLTAKQRTFHTTCANAMAGVFGPAGKWLAPTNSKLMPAPALVCEIKRRLITQRELVVAAEEEVADWFQRENLSEAALRKLRAKKITVREKHKNHLRQLAAYKKECKRRGVILAKLNTPGSSGTWTADHQRRLLRLLLQGRAIALCRPSSTATPRMPAWRSSATPRRPSTRCIRLVA